MDALRNVNFNGSILRNAKFSGTICEGVDFTDCDLRNAEFENASLENNDLVISAHSYKSQFGLIKNLNQGDKLIFTDVSSKAYVFEVKVIEILSPTDVEEMINSEFDLTLYTCTKDSKNRVTVRLNKIDDF